MYVRCTHCGYDNSPEYRFCGMCGAALAHPPVIQQPSVKEPGRAATSGNSQTENVHGPSFLGLAEDPKVEFSYLYEDQQPRSHVGLIVLILMVLGAGGFLGWQYRNNGFPFTRGGATSGEQASASPSEVAPAQSQDRDTHINKPMTGAGDVLPTQPDQNAKPDQASGPSETDIPPANGAEADNGARQNPTAQNAATSQPSNATQGASSNSAQDGGQPAPGQKSPAPANENQEAKAMPPPGVAEASKLAKEPVPTRAEKPAPSHPSVAAQPGAADTELEQAGERYLYGNGVPPNCARAESSLRTAAMHSNSKAQTVLGTMYATGHCVGRDLPTAYRWFARALHEEPQNGRISEDLQVLWRQMTPQEKQLAMAGEQH
jgi:zinc-ribbon domain